MTLANTLRTCNLTLDQCGARRHLEVLPAEQKSAEVELLTAKHVPLPTKRAAYTFAREQGATAMRAWAFAKVAKGACMTREGWLSVLASPSAFEMKERQ